MFIKDVTKHWSFDYLLKYTKNIFKYVNRYHTYDLLKQAKPLTMGLHEAHIMWWVND